MFRGADIAGVIWTEAVRPPLRIPFANSVWKNVYGRLERNSGQWAGAG